MIWIWAEEAVDTYICIGQRCCRWRCKAGGKEEDHREDKWMWWKTSRKLAWQRRMLGVRVTRKPMICCGGPAMEQPKEEDKCCLTQIIRCSSSVTLLLKTQRCWTWSSFCIRYIIVFLTQDNGAVKIIRNNMKYPPVTWIWVLAARPALRSNFVKAVRDASPLETLFTL